MNPSIQIIIRSVLILLAIVLCYMLYQLYFFAKGVQDDLVQRDQIAEKFLLAHEMSGVIIHQKNANQNQSSEYTVQLSEHSVQKIPCMNQYIVNCDSLEQVRRITLAQKFHSIPQIGQKVCKPKGRVIFEFCS